MSKYKTLHDMNKGGGRGGGELCENKTPLRTQLFMLFRPKTHSQITNQLQRSVWTVNAGPT